MTAGQAVECSTPRIDEHQRTLVELVMTKLRARYGAKLADAYPYQGDARLMARVKAEWAEALQPFAVEQVRGAMELCRTRHPSWPPTCDEFALLCRSVPRHHVPALPAPRTAPPQGVFERMRAVIGATRPAAKTG